jgi:chromosome segregation ATPase
MTRLKGLTVSYKDALLALANVDVNAKPAVKAPLEKAVQDAEFELDAYEAEIGESIRQYQDSCKDLNELVVSTAGELEQVKAECEKSQSDLQTATESIESLTEQLEKVGAKPKGPSEAEMLGKSLQAKADAKREQELQDQKESKKKDPTSEEAKKEQQAKDDHAKKMADHAEKLRKKEEKEALDAAKKKGMSVVRITRGVTGAPFHLGAAIGSLWIDAEARCTELVQQGYATPVS